MVEQGLVRDDAAEGLGVGDVAGHTHAGAALQVGLLGEDVAEGQVAQAVDRDGELLVQDAALAGAGLAELFPRLHHRG